MFTGIVLDVGQIVAIDADNEQRHLTIRTALNLSSSQPGDSVAVDGCCLTITFKPTSDTFCATLSPETLRLTTFGNASLGTPVNLEPALRLGDPLGGHWVTGHVDGLATLLAISPVGEHRVMEFSVPADLAKYLVTKGSVTLNGVSLTLNEVDENRFSVNLIPHTLAHTNLGNLSVGDGVNLETDILGRYIERLTLYKGTA